MQSAERVCTIPIAKLLACEQALLFVRVKRVLRERPSERRSLEGQRKGFLFLGPSLARSREARFACLNRRACSQATKLLITCTLYESSTPRPTHRRFMQQFFHNFDELIHEWRKSCTTVQEGKGRETLL